MKRKWATLKLIRGGRGKSGMSNWKGPGDVRQLVLLTFPLERQKNLSETTTKGEKMVVPGKGKHKKGQRATK